MDDSFDLTGDEVIDSQNVSENVKKLKRKRSTDSTLDATSIANKAVISLGNMIESELAASSPDDSVHRCGRAVISILATNPEYTLELAKDMINSWEYRKVPYCWLRLYEDSTLYQATALLRACPGDYGRSLNRIVELLDHAIITSGGHGRAELFATIFERLQKSHGHMDKNADLPESLTVVQPEDLATKHAIPSTDAPSLAEFQKHIDRDTTPLLIRGAIDHWPAMESWHKTSYLLQHTLGGRRLVPVEIGKTYTHSQWRQQLMPFREYMQKYLLPASPEEVGYMGQHDLFNQIPSLRSDIATPDYCYTALPDTIPESLVGLPSASELLEPQLNAWLGPKGTRSPLHHDPYHNIFCQVVGYKYVRLYPPSATTCMYPRAMDGNGISLSNTSSVNVKFDAKQAGNIYEQNADECPLFGSAQGYQEAIVGPGESLYIPAGWWHYFESLTASFSVSFWWN